MHVPQQAASRSADGKAGGKRLAGCFYAEGPERFLNVCCSPSFGVILHGDGRNACAWPTCTYVATWPHGATAVKQLFDSDVTDAAQVNGFLMLGLVREREHSSVVPSVHCTLYTTCLQLPPLFSSTVCCCCLWHNEPSKPNALVRWCCDGGTHALAQSVSHNPLQTSGQEASNSPLWCTATNRPTMHGACWRHASSACDGESVPPPQQGSVT